MTAKKVLRTDVYVHDGEGEAVHYKAGESPTAKHAKLITNPKAWATDDQSQPEPEAPEQPTDPGTPES